LNKVRQSLAGLNVRENPEERLTYQVMDLQLIKYNGIQSGDIVPHDSISEAIDKTIEGFIWIYEKGLSLESNVNEKLETEEDKQKYGDIMNAFAKFNDFMRTHMSLKE
jgi:hypothetical protein